MFDVISYKSHLFNEAVHNSFSNIQRNLEMVFSQKLARTTKNDPISNRIAHILEWSKQTKLVSYWEDILATLSSQIHPYTLNNEPIQILSAWWAKKDKCENEQYLDTAELSMFLMLYTINKIVKQIYTPWVKFIIINEDLWDKYLFRHYVNDLDTKIWAYTNNLKILSEGLREVHENSITSINESSILSEKNIHSDAFVEQCNSYIPFFLRYLKESDTLMENWWNGISNLDSYKELEKLWWIGNIPFEMREYYYQRLDNMYWCDLDGKQLCLAEMFSSALSRKYFSITKTDLNWTGLDPLRMSFAAPSPWMPTKNGRLFFRCIPKNIYSWCIPYWTWNGVLKKNWNDIYPKILSRYNPVDIQENLIEIDNVTTPIQANITQL